MCTETFYLKHDVIACVIYYIKCQYIYIYIYNGLNCMIFHFKLHKATLHSR